MSLKPFLASDGRVWSVWRVQSGSAGQMAGMPGEWLAFQSEDGTERRRLFEIPDQWEDLPDDRLDLLRRMAEPSRSAERPSPPGGMDRIIHNDELHQR